MSESILRGINLPQLVARNRTDYIKLATCLATDKKYYQKIQTKIKKNKKNIFNVKAFTKVLEEAYNEAILRKNK